MRDQEKILVFVMVVLICNNGQQQCTHRWPWPQYFEAIYCRLGSYQFQRNRSNYNVKNLNNWGKGGEQGIHITTDNHKTFLNKMSEYKLCLDQSEELNGSQIEQLNSLLEMSLTNVPKIECRNGILRLTGTFIKFSDLPSGGQCDGRDIEKIEIFAADRFYVDKDYTNDRTDIHLSIMAPLLISLGNYTINLPSGDFLSVAEHVAKTPNRFLVTDNDRYGQSSYFRQNGVHFIESTEGKREWWAPQKSAEYFVTGIQNFKTFLNEAFANNSNILREIIRSFLIKITSNPRTTANIDLKNLSFKLDNYESYKNIKLLSNQLQLPLQDDERVLNDKKIAKFIEIMNFTQNYKLEDKKFRSLVVDMNGLVTSIIANLEGIDKAYSVSILKRVADPKADNEVRKIDLATIRQQRRKLEVYLLDLAESDFDLIAAVNVEVSEAIIRLEKIKAAEVEASMKMNRFSPDEANNIWNYARRKFLVEVVGKVANLLSSVPLTLKLTKSNTDNHYLQSIKILTNQTFLLCDKITNQVEPRDASGLKEFDVSEENDFCDSLRPLTKAAGELVANTIGNYSDLHSLFYKFDVEGLLHLIGKVASKNFEKFDELKRPIYALKVALKRAIEIADVVEKFHRHLILEKYVTELMTLEYGEAIIKDLAKLGEDDGNNIEILRYKSDKPADDAIKLMETIKRLEEFSKSQVIVLEYNSLINAIKQCSFPLAHLYLTNYDLPLEKDGHSQLTSITQMIRRFKNGIWKSKEAFKYDELKIFPVEFGAENPFYTWNNPRYITDLLMGKEVVLTADIRESDPGLNAIKFNRINLIFEVPVSPTLQQNYTEESRKWIFAVTRLGDSKFHCDGKIYAVATPSQKFLFSLTQPLLPNSVYNAITNGSYVLSPYATWKIQIIGLNVPVTKQFLGFANNSSLRLVGTAQYYKGDSNLCSENLDQYYDRADAKEFGPTPSEVPSKPVECPSE